VSIWAVDLGAQLAAVLGKTISSFRADAGGISFPLYISRAVFVASLHGMASSFSSLNPYISRREAFIIIIYGII